MAVADHRGRASSRARRRSTSCGSTGRDVWWSEGRPTEGGRTQLVRRAAGEEPQDVLPDGWNARTQVHEYGGGAWTVRDGVLWFSAWADQRLYRLDVGAGQAVPQPVTPNPLAPRALRYADADLSPDGEWLVCVRERHEAGRRGGQRDRRAAGLAGRGRG